MLGNTQGLQAAVTLAEPGPVCKQALLTPCPAPRCGTHGICPRHPKAAPGSDSPLGTKSSHVLLPPETRAWPKAPEALHHSDKHTQVLSMKGWVWITGHSQGRAQGGKGLQVGSVRHQE